MSSEKDASILALPSHSNFYIVFGLAFHGQQKKKSPAADKKTNSNNCEDEEVFTALNMADDVGSQLQNIFQRLEKLDSLELLLNKALLELNAMETHINHLDIKIESLEAKSRAVDKEIGNWSANFASKQ